MTSNDLHLLKNVIYIYDRNYMCREGFELELGLRRQMNAFWEKGGGDFYKYKLLYKSSAAAQLIRFESKQFQFQNILKLW